MKRFLFAAALAAVLPWKVGAQVEKQVEVTKAYVPRIESAAKLSVEPDMTDTVRIRPEIDYTITPLSLQTALVTRPIRPASVTYWEFNRPLPFYLKAGAGYPLNSVLDFYAATQHPGTGYAVGYVNHEGRYADVRNDFGVKNNSVRMLNRAGVAAGKYLGRHVLEGEVAYENRLYHRYGYGAAAPSGGVGFPASGYGPGSKLDYGDLTAALRIGDDFQDLSRTNFEVGVTGGYYMSGPCLSDVEASLPGAAAPQTFDFSRACARQLSVGASGRLARAFGRHRFSLGAGYDYLKESGDKPLASVSFRPDAGYGDLDVTQQRIHASLRYGIDGRAVRFEVGADYFHDSYEAGGFAGTETAGSGGQSEKHDYVIPFLRFDFNLGTEALRPFVEADGSVRDNSLRTLTRLNPYLPFDAWGGKSSVDYNGRLGIGGSLWKGRFAYRLFAAFSVRDNHAYVYGLTPGYAGEGEGVVAGPAVGPELRFAFGRQTVTSFHGELTWRPVSSLRFDLGAHAFIYNDEGVRLAGGAFDLDRGEPAFRGEFSVRYDGKKISAGAGVDLQSVRRWSWLVPNAAEYAVGTPFEAPFAADLHVDFEWRVSGRVSLFAEGRNLLDRRLYDYPWYPEYGAHFTAGVKLCF